MQDSLFAEEHEKLKSYISSFGIRDLAMYLLAAREYAGLTQKELSRKTGISQANISRLENGLRNPSIALLQRIADALNMSLRIEIIPKTSA